MPVLAQTKGQKKAARKAAKRKAALATEKAFPSGAKYTLVGTIQSERFDMPDISCNSAALTSTVMDFKRPRSNTGLPIGITKENPAPTVSQQLWPLNKIIHPSETPFTSPTWTILPLESLDNFGDSFTFETTTPILSNAKAPEFSTISSCEKSIDGFCKRKTDSLAFSEEFMDELTRTQFMTAEASSQAFEEALSRTFDTVESTIFTRLQSAGSPKVLPSVYIPKYIFTTLEMKEEGYSLVSSRPAFGPWPPLQHSVQPHAVECVETITIRMTSICQPVYTMSARMAISACTEANRLYRVQLHVPSQDNVTNPVLSSADLTKPTRDALEPQTRNRMQRAYSDYAHENWALVPYVEPRSIHSCTDFKIFDEPDTSLSLKSILSSRLFLADANGVIQCSDIDKLLHNVETTHDDRDHGIESMTSPTKKEIRGFVGGNA